jgi:predicted nucleic acid-binding protein
VSEQLLLDASAWHRLYDESLPDSRAEELAEDWESGGLVVSLPFLLEAGHSARSAADYSAVMAELTILPLIPIDEECERRALDAQAQLVRVGHHRMPPVDILLAAIADHGSLGVLHYDAHFDTLLEKTDLDFHSEWLMPRGSL